MKQLQGFSFDENHENFVPFVAGTDGTGDRGRTQNRGRINQNGAKQGDAASDKRVQCISRWQITPLCVLHGSGGGKEGRVR